MKFTAFVQSTALSSQQSKGPFKISKSDKLHLSVIIPPGAG